jgi:hypothetical protein
MRFLKFLTGLLLLPGCLVVARLAYGLLAIMTESGLNTGSHDGRWLMGGVGLWLLCYFTMSPPVRTYVFGHELTHALWATLMGSKVTAFSVGPDGGHVEVSRVNFLIMLAPYFFPIYTFAVVGLYALLSILVDLSAWHGLWLVLIGFTYAFHFTFTLLALAQQQSDVHENGRLFSYAVIVLMNLLLVALAMVCFSSPSLGDFFRLLGEEAQVVGRWIANHLVLPLLDEAY